MPVATPALGHGVAARSTPATPLTFKEDKSAIVPLVGSVDVPGQAPPEVPDGHGVVVQHPVVPHPPEPPALLGSGVSAGHTGTELCAQEARAPSPH